MNQVALTVHEVIFNAVVVLTGVTHGIGVTVIELHSLSGLLCTGWAVHIRLKRVSDDPHLAVAAC